MGDIPDGVEVISIMPSILLYDFRSLSPISAVFVL